MYYIAWKEEGESKDILIDSYGFICRFTAVLIGSGVRIISVEVIK